MYTTSKNDGTILVHIPCKGELQFCFLQNFLIVISQLLLHGIAQNFRWNIRTLRDEIDIISVILPH